MTSSDYRTATLADTARTASKDLHRIAVGTGGCPSLRRLRLQIAAIARRIDNGLDEVQEPTT